MLDANTATDQLEIEANNNQADDRTLSMVTYYESEG